METNNAPPAITDGRYREDEDGVVPNMHVVRTRGLVRGRLIEVLQ